MLDQELLQDCDGLNHRTWQTQIFAKMGAKVGRDDCVCLQRNGNHVGDLLGIMLHFVKMCSFPHVWRFLGHTIIYLFVLIYSEISQTNAGQLKYMTI